MVNENEAATKIEEPPRSEGFLDVFVVRSFRESHLQDVVDAIEEFINSYQSPYWQSTAYRVVDTEQDISSGHFLQDEITMKIRNAAVTIVILDGLRHNVLFELGFLYSSSKPFILLKHKRWGPSFSELDLLASDVKGVVVKEFDHKDESSFKELLDSEFRRCEGGFVSDLGTHTLLPTSGENLVQHEWAFQNSERKDPRSDRTNEAIQLTSGQWVDLEIKRHISTSSLFVVEFDLTKSDAGLVAYLLVRFRKAEKNIVVWFGYSSYIVSPILCQRPEKGAEITIPFPASGPGAHILVDKIYEMVVQRLGSADPGRLLVDKIRLRGRENSLTRVSKVLITEC